MSDAKWTDKKKCVCCKCFWTKICVDIINPKIKQTQDIIICHNEPEAGAEMKWARHRMKNIVVISSICGFQNIRHTKMKRYQDRTSNNMWDRGKKWQMAAM